ncbi:MAG: DNA polymerase Y family protein [Salaquimonas sp.]
MTNALPFLPNLPDHPQGTTGPTIKREQKPMPDAELELVSAPPAKAESATSKETRRYLAIHLPTLPTDRISRLQGNACWRLNAKQADQERPRIVVAKIKNAIRLVHLNEQATQLSLSAGMSLTDAKAAYPDIDVLQQDREADQLLLNAIADWCDRYTPLVAIDHAMQDHYGLMLDITGCAHLFGGEAALAKDLLARLFHQGFAATGALAPTPGAAWALSRFKNKNSDYNGCVKIKTVKDIEPALSSLPLAALRLTTDSVSALARLGLRSIGQLSLQPRAPLARRFGREILYKLDQAMGAIEEAISPRRPVAELMAERRLAEPISLETDIEQVTQRLARHLSEAMERKGIGARQFQLCLFRVDGRTFYLEAGTSRAERDSQIITRLFRERFASLQDDFDAGYGFETIRLCVLSSERLELNETSFLGSAKDDEASQLMDRLAARIGVENITRGSLENTHLPESAERKIPANQYIERPDQADDHMDDITLTRPLRLFSLPEAIDAIASVPDGPPIRFRWRKILHTVTKVEGPERISDQWWAKPFPRQTRDYFRIEDDQGCRYWLFREGLYERGTDRPKWFLHGLFA